MKADRFCGLVGLLFGVVLAGAPPALAQDPPGDTEPVPTEFGHVAVSADEVDETLRGVRQALVSDPDVQKVEGKFPEQVLALDAQIKALRVLLDGDASSADVDEAERQFLKRQQRLESWRDLVTTRGDEVEARLKEVSHLRFSWTRTRRSAAEDGAPDSVRATLDRVFQSLAEAERQLADRRSLLLILQNQITQQRSRVANALEEIAAERSELRRRVFERDAPSLWSLLGEQTEGTGSPIAVAADAAARNSETFRSYFIGKEERFITHAAALGVLFFLAITMWRRRETWLGEDEELEASRVVLERPVSTAALVALLLTPALHPLAPAIVENLAGLALIGPVVRLLPRMVSKTLRPAVYGFSLFYLLDQLRVFIEPASALARSLFALELLGAALLFLWMLRPAAYARLSLPLGWLLRLGALLLLGSFVANAIGFLSLAYLIGEATLRAAYAALVLYGALRTTQAMLRVLLRTPFFRRSRLVRAYPRLLLQWAGSLLKVGAIGVWALLTASAFEIDGLLVERARGTLNASAHFGSYEVRLGDLALFAVTLVAAILLSRFTRFVLHDEVLPRFSMPRGVSTAITTSARYLILLFGFGLALAAAGIDPNRFTILAGAFGVGIGFGLQNIVNNFVSGLILIFERPIQVGDSIEVSGVLGEVKRIGIRSSTVRTWQGAEVILPNAQLISDEVTNWTLSDRQRRMEIRVGVEYGTDPARVLRILQEVASDHPEVLESPEPVALFLGFGESSLDFELRAWTPRFENYLQTQSELALGLHGALSDAGIGIPFPQRDLHLRSTPELAAPASSA